MTFEEILAEALRRMAAHERGEAARWRRVARWARTPHYRELGVADPWADEHDARAEIYEDWAQALSFPGGPVHVDWVRYGCSRESLAS